jgi:DNA repair photolyase
MAVSGTTRKRAESDTRKKGSGLSKEIIKESQHWIRSAKGQKATKGYKAAHIPAMILECAMPLAFDQYNLCSMGCTYCFAHVSKLSNPTWKGKDIGLQGVDYKKQIKCMQGRGSGAYEEAMYEHFYSKKFPLHWGTLTDPFCAFEKQNRFGLRMIEALGEMNYPCVFNFKGRTVFHPDYVKVFERYAKQKNFAFQCTITCPDDKVSRQLEIGVPPTSERLRALEMLSDMGYWTIMRLRPYIIGITDRGIDDLLIRAQQAGIKGITMGYLCVDVRASGGAKLRYKHIGQMMGVKNLIKHYKELSHPERGAYLRANRLLKEEHSKRLYKFCDRFGIVFSNSDPDYKELGFSGNCCALPAKYKPNPGLSNWTRDQTTSRLIKARRTYNMTGRCLEFRFNEIFTADATYLDEVQFGNDHVAVIGRTTGERAVITQRDILREQWNNLNSGGNPRNFYAGKILPVSTDDAGDLVYKYAPSDYERRWSEEGIDLTR